MEEHYEAIICKAYKSLGILRRVSKDSHSPQARKCLNISLVQSNLLYRSPLWWPYLLKNMRECKEEQQNSYCQITPLTTKID